MSDAIQSILFLIYAVAGWWAVNKVWYSRRTYIVVNPAKFYGGKFAMAILLGWLAIPIAIIMIILRK